MNRHTKKDALLHANLAIQHPSRADSLRHIKTTTHSRSTEESEVREESAVATSTPRPPPLMPAPAARPPPLMPAPAARQPPRRPAQAARLPPLMPAQAATKTATEKCMPPVLFKKPESFVRAKKLITLQKPLADTIISKMNIQGSRSVSFNKHSNNDPLATFKNQEEMEQFCRDQEEMRKFHQKRNAGSSTFSIDYLLSPNKNQSIRDHIKNLRDVRKNVRHCPDSSNNAALPAESGMSANFSPATQFVEGGHEFQTFSNTQNGPISAEIQTLYAKSAVSLPAISHESANF
jgi:hypothetical protein